MLRQVGKSVFKIFIVISLITGAHVTALQAQKVDPKRLAAAKELIRVINLDKMMESMLPAMMNQLKSLEIQRYPGRKKEINEIFSAVLEIFKDRVGELNSKVAILYAETFTADELNELTKFYQSPLGKKILSRLPGLMQRSMKMGQEWGMSLLPEMMKKIQELKKKRNL